MVCRACIGDIYDSWPSGIENYSIFHPFLFPLVYLDQTIQHSNTKIIILTSNSHRHHRRGAMFGVNLSEQRQISPDNLSVQGPGDEELAVPGEGEAGHGLVVVVHGRQQLALANLDTKWLNLA